MAKYLLYIQKTVCIQKLLSLAYIFRNKNKGSTTNKMKNILLILLLIVPGFILSGQKATVKWYTIEEAEKLADKGRLSDDIRNKIESNQMSERRSKKVSESVITMTELVLPNYTNQLGNLLGGQLMHWIDICAALAAAKHSNRICVTASVDRIDPKRGYEEDNLQFVHKDVNLMKNRFDEPYFIEMCKLIVGNSCLAKN